MVPRAFTLLQIIGGAERLDEKEYGEPTVSFKHIRLIQYSEHLDLHSEDKSRTVIANPKNQSNNGWVYSEVAAAVL